MISIDEDILKKASLCINVLKEKKLKIVIAESCTGGLLSCIFTSIPNASKILDRGFVVYSNEAKMEILKVDKDIIKNYGAVSKETAIQMAIGALNNSHANVAISITGIAGPNTDESKKPKGLVYIGFAQSNQDHDYKEFRFSQKFTRNKIQLMSANAALDFILFKIKNT